MNHLPHHSDIFILAARFHVFIKAHQPIAVSCNFNHVREMKMTKKKKKKDVKNKKKKDTSFTEFLPLALFLEQEVTLRSKHLVGTRIESLKHNQILRLPMFTGFFCFFFFPILFIYLLSKVVSNCLRLINF